MCQIKQQLARKFCKVRNLHSDNLVAEVERRLRVFVCLVSGRYVQRIKFKVLPAMEISSASLICGDTCPR